MNNKDIVNQLELDDLKYRRIDSHKIIDGKAVDFYLSDYKASQEKFILGGDLVPLGDEDYKDLFLASPESLYKELLTNTSRRLSREELEEAYIRSELKEFNTNRRKYIS